MLSYYYVQSASLDEVNLQLCLGDDILSANRYYLPHFEDGCPGSSSNLTTVGCAKTVFSNIHSKPMQTPFWSTSVRWGRHTSSRISETATFLQYSSPGLLLHSGTGSNLCFLDLLQCSVSVHALSLSQYFPLLQANQAAAKPVNQDEGRYYNKEHDWSFHICRLVLKIYLLIYRYTHFHVIG